MRAKDFLNFVVDFHTLPPLGLRPISEKDPPESERIISSVSDPQYAASLEVLKVFPETAGSSDRVVSRGAQQRCSTAC
jgi:hypothetical protein